MQPVALRSRNHLVWNMPVGCIQSIYTRTKIYKVLATDPGNPPAVWDWSGKTDRIGCRTVQNPTCCFLAVQTGPRTPRPVGMDGCGRTCQVQSPVLRFGFFYLWLHSVILLLIAKYWLWYCTFIFWCIDNLYIANRERDALCPILLTSVNRASTIDRLASWAI